MERIRIVLDEVLGHSDLNLGLARRIAAALAEAPKANPMRDLYRVCCEDRERLAAKLAELALEREAPPTAALREERDNALRLAQVARDAGDRAVAQGMAQLRALREALDTIESWLNAVHSGPQPDTVPAKARRAGEIMTLEGCIDVLRAALARQEEPREPTEAEEAAHRFPDDT